MKHKIFSLFTSFVLLANLYSATEENTGWSTVQSIEQAFYIFDSNIFTINDSVIQPEDVIGAFTADDGYCVGWTYATTDGNGYLTVPVLGNDGSDYSVNYLENGEIPVFRVYDHSEGNGTTVQTQDAVLPVSFQGTWLENGDDEYESDGGFSNNMIFVLGDNGSFSASHFFGCYDSQTCEYSEHWLEAIDEDSDGDYDQFPTQGGMITTDDFSCWSAEPGCACSNGQGAELDDCGVCEGDNADMDCAGTCFGQAELDCAGECNGNAVVDCTGECNGDAVIDECGECEGEGATLTCWDGSFVCDPDDCPEQLDNDESLPGSFEIFNVYPNPFNPSTLISFSLSTAEEINITVLNAIGNEVEILFDGFKGAGYHQLSWTPSINISTGSYFLKVLTPSNAFIRKVIYLK